MGNRAVITTNENLTETGIYLHWNGGRDSVEAFLDYCRIRGYRSPGFQSDYAMARLTQVIANFFDGGLSIGVAPANMLDTDNGDNGTYIIGGNWEITKRLFFDNRVEQNSYNRTDFLIAIDEAQPQPIGKDFFTAQEVKTSELKPGDYVFFFDDLHGTYTKEKIIGYGEGTVNGTDRTGQPYIGKYGKDNGREKQNPNNYFDTPTVKRATPTEPEKAPEPASGDRVKVTINKDLDGIEIKFSVKPLDVTREELKKNGFHWHSKKKVWYAKKTLERMDFVQTLTQEVIK